MLQSEPGLTFTDLPDNEPAEERVDNDQMEEAPGKVQIGDLVDTEDGWWPELRNKRKETGRQGIDDEEDDEDLLIDLEEQLKDAVKNEKYEQASILRDKIKLIKKK